MPAFQDAAIVLRRWDFRETSQVLVLLTRDHGKVRCLAKGIKRRNPKFSGPADLLAEAEVMVLPGRPGTLSLLVECDLLDFRPRLRRRRRPLLAGLHAARSLDLLLPEDEPHRAAFEAARATLSALDDGAEPREAVLRFETTLLKGLGSLPSFSRCGRCGEDPGGGPLPYDPARGGVLCERCAGPAPPARLPPRVVEALRGLSEFARPDRIRVDPADAAACHAAIDAAIRHAAGVRPPARPRGPL